MEHDSITPEGLPGLLALDCRDILTFIVVAETQSAGRAATLLGCSQSTVSLRLKRFRLLTGTSLFTREGRTLQPTTGAIQLAMRLKHSLTRLDGIIRDG